MTNQSEAFSRILIDEELTYSDWDLYDTHQVRFDYHVQNGRLADQERVSGGRWRDGLSVIKTITECRIKI